MHRDFGAEYLASRLVLVAVISKQCTFRFGLPPASSDCSFRDRSDTSQFFWFSIWFKAISSLFSEFLYLLVTLCAPGEKDGPNLSTELLEQRSNGDGNPSNERFDASMGAKYSIDPVRVVAKTFELHCKVGGLGNTLFTAWQTIWPGSVSRAFQLAEAEELWHTHNAFCLGRWSQSA